MALPRARSRPAYQEVSASLLPVGRRNHGPLDVAGDLHDASQAAKDIGRRITGGNDADDRTSLFGNEHALPPVANILYDFQAMRLELRHRHPLHSHLDFTIVIFS